MQANGRTTPYDIDPMFLERWSPRAFTTEELPVESLMTMLEAARWAASSSNSQPWRFVYARRGTEPWDKLLGVLVPFNQEWAQHAAALVFVISANQSRSPQSGEMKPLPTHSFDTGAATTCMVLQALKMGWHTHGMYGFDQDRARTSLKVPDDHTVEAVFAIGKLGDKTQLSEALQQRESPSDRNSLDQMVFEGTL